MKSLKPEDAFNTVLWNVLLFHKIWYQLPSNILDVKWLFAADEIADKMRSSKNGFLSQQKARKYIEKYTKKFEFLKLIFFNSLNS